jgi:TRAP-type mannitol/chloroaromatic compound transport system substrate-binding protein
MTERRQFLTKASSAMAAVAAATLVDAPKLIAQPKIQWRMATTWVPALDQLNGAAQRMAKVVDEMSGGRFRIEVLPGGQSMQPFECFGAASQGKIEAFMGAPSYWWEQESAIEWFCTVPFGMNAEGMTAWLYRGDELKLWRHLRALQSRAPPGAR